MNGLPTTLIGAPVLNQAGSSNTSTGSANNYSNQLAGALNSSALASGAIGTPVASLLSGAEQSANQYNAQQSNPETNSDNHPILSGDGQWVSSTTGQAWHGSYQNPNGSTQYYSNGQQVSDIGQVGNQLPNISVQQIQKNPAISSQVAGAVSQNAQNTGLLSKSFNDYLNEANTVASQAPSQLSAAESAINPAGTIATENANVANTGASLNSNLANLTAEQRANLGNIAGTNQQYQTTQQAALGNLGTTLTNQTNDYQTAAQNVANQAYANALKQSNLYQLTSGTPTSGSGALDNRYIAAYDQVNLPLQQQLAQMRLGQTNQLYNLGSNLQNQYLQNAMNLYGQTGNVNTQLAGQANTNTQYMSGLDQQTAQYVQGLQQQVASMTPQLAMSYLQAMGVPMQMAQQIIAGQTSNLAGLTTLDQQANSYNMVTPYQNNAPQYTVPRVGIPSAPNNGTGTANNYGMGPLINQSNAAQNATAAAQQGYTDANGNYWQIQTGANGQPQWVQTFQATAAPSNPAANNYGIPGGSAGAQDAVLNAPSQGGLMPGLDYAVPY